MTQAMHTATTRLRLFAGLLILLPFTLLASSQYDQITRGKQQITLQYDSSFTEAERRMIYRWLEKVADGLRTVYGELPQDNFRIDVERSSRQSGPVPWGEVDRDEPTTVTLQINPEYGYDGLLADWTAFHELSHLLLPYQGYGDVWISEGLATYYQNITQARSGLFTETQMWQDIVDGLERGRKQITSSHTTLSEVSDSMREHRLFMRVYWSGVLYWLSSDVELRKQGKGTLDEALKKLKDCCETHSMSAAQIAYRLDALMNTNLFLPKFRQYSQSHAMPDYKSILRELGVQKKEQNGEVILVKNSLSDIRRQIYIKGY